MKLSVRKIKNTGAAFMWMLIFLGLLGKGVLWVMAELGFRW